MAVEVPGEPHAPVDLDVLGGDHRRGFGDEALGQRGGGFALRIVDDARPGRVVRGHPGQLELVEHVDDLVLDDLERGDRPVELHPLLGVLGGHVQGPVAGTDALGAEHDADVVDHLRQERPLVAVGSDAARGPGVEHEAGELAGDVE